MVLSDLAENIGEVMVEYCNTNEVSFEDVVDTFSNILLAISPFDRIKIEFDGDDE